MTWGTPGTLEPHEIRAERRERLIRALPIIAAAVAVVAVGTYTWFS